MWKNNVWPDRVQMTIWRMRVAWWITKGTNTHSEYVILHCFFHSNNCCTNAPQHYRHSYIWQHGTTNHNHRLALIKFKKSRYAVTFIVLVIEIWIVQYMSLVIFHYNWWLFIVAKICAKIIIIDVKITFCTCTFLRAFFVLAADGMSHIRVLQSVLQYLLPEGLQCLLNCLYVSLAAYRYEVLQKQYRKSYWH